MKTVCGEKLCNGCGACVAKCKRNAISIVDHMSSYDAVINEEKCIQCGACTLICPNNNMPELNEPLNIVQGWANSDAIRKQASSGGIASALMKGFAKHGGYVCSCTFRDGQFVFETSNELNCYEIFRGSKYVKSNPLEAYSKIENLLKSGCKVLFIGLPCQVAGIKNYINKIMYSNLYTVDLICHGTPSVKCLDYFLKDNELTLNELQDISFREKNSFRLNYKRSELADRNTADSYTISFLNGLNYTENCYYCKFAQIKRCSDLTLGDSWGSELNDSEKEKGISLILCQTERGKKLLEECDIKTFPVDEKKAVEHNHQLEHPSIIPKHRNLFFNNIKQQRLSYTRIIFNIYPQYMIRQSIKKCLIKLRLIKIRGV